MDETILRIKRIIDLYQCSMAGFEKKCGVANGAISQPAHGYKKISAKTISKISFYTPFQIQWLMDGTGEPFKKILLYSLAEFVLYNYLIKKLSLVIKTVSLLFIQTFIFHCFTKCFTWFYFFIRI